MYRNADGNAFQNVKLIADAISDDERTGKYYPQKIQAIQPNRINIMIDSEDRLPTSPNDFNFRVDFKQDVFVRQIYLSSCILPLCPTVNKNNDVINVTVDGNTFNISLDDSFYNPTSFANHLQQKFTAAWQANVDPTADCLVTYDPAGRFISVEDISPALIGGPFAFTFNESKYSKYGVHVCEFKTGVAQVVHTSVSLEMIYSRYYFIKSYRLTNNQRAATIASGPTSLDIVAVVPISSEYNSLQFQTETFPGTSRNFILHNPPVINTTALTSFREVDIRVEDEYGFNLSDIYNDDSFRYSNMFLFVGDYY